MKKISIRERLILYFVILSIISIAIVSLFSIFEAKKGIRERVFSQLILLRDIRREQILSFYYSRGKELKALAATINIRLPGSGLSDQIKPEELERALINDEQVIGLVMDERNCKSLFLVTKSKSAFQISRAENKFIIEYDSSFQVSSDLDHFFSSNPAGNDYTILEKFQENNQLNLLIVVPVIDREMNVAAALILELKPEALYEQIYNKEPGSGLGRTGEAYLASPDGYMRTPSRFIPESVRKIKVNTKGFEAAIGGQEGTGIYNDYRGINVLGAYGMIVAGNYRQVILAEIDVSEAMVPLIVIRNEILIVSSLILLAIFIITWFLAHGITRPLVRLKNAANFISAGNYSQRLEINSDDEIGELTMAFNTMSEEINATTKELKEKEESLRHFYEATLDGIVLHDNGQMVHYNASILRLTGYSEIEFKDFSIQDILRDIKEMQCDKDQGNEMYETVLVRKDKSAIPVEVQDSCVEFEGRNIRASVIRDIRSRKKMELDLVNERNKRIRAVFDARDTEQQRLSRELHDGLGQQLVAGKLILESSLYERGSNLKAKILEAQHIFDQIIGDIRRISHDLSPSILKEFGLKAAMENLCRNIMKAKGILIDFQFELGDHPLDELASTYLFRIAQESLNNVQLHSGANHVKIILRSDEYGILLEIEDDGKGFDLKKVSGSGGTGLYNIRERVNILRGQLSIISSLKNGTKIQVRIPVDHSTAEQKLYG